MTHQVHAFEPPERFVAGTVAGDAIVLPGANRPGVARVRYAWADAPYVNLYSATDLPVVPFELAVDQGTDK